MSWYKGYKSEWKEIIETVAREIGRSEQIVEKDTIQSFFLEELSKGKLPYVFKGGTSLSKAYGLIDRFSEDIDLTMERRPTQSERIQSSKEILNIADNLGLWLINAEQIRSRYDYNKYVFQYNSLITEEISEIIIETNFYQGICDNKVNKIGSYVGDFCKDKEIKLPIPFDASIVCMRIQTVERTFVDKVFAVCDCRIQNKSERESRHLYDIYKLIKYVNLNAKMGEYVDVIRENRMLLKSNPSAKLEYDIPRILEEIIRSEFFKKDYNDITKKLLYEQISYNEVVKYGIEQVAKSDVFIYKNKKDNKK